MTWQAGAGVARTSTPLPMSVSTPATLFPILLLIMPIAPAPLAARLDSSIRSAAQACRMGMRLLLRRAKGKVGRNCGKKFEAT
jgi:hypothetical protein